jgi:multiple sugar transport system ATP-binding protein
MASAEFERVCKKFGDTVALDEFSLRVAHGELITVLGPSGCGKSTLLRLTAGLESPTAGSIRLGMQRIDTLPPHRRNVAMVFQNYALYPHMTVRANIEFPLRMRQVGRAERRAQARDIAALLELDELLERRPAQLSGGQRQRVALARALVRSPALFLLDEPLSNLDARLRLSVRQYIRDVQQRLGVTTLYVTHDQTEAMTLGDRIVVMRDGQIQQRDTPVHIYERPANAFVAGFVGTPPMNLLQAQVAYGMLSVGEQSISLTRLSNHLLASLTPGPVTLGIRPEAFSAADEGGERIRAVTDPASREVLGSETLVRGVIGNESIRIRLPGVVREVPRAVVAYPGEMHFFDSVSGSRIDG